MTTTTTKDQMVCKHCGSSEHIRRDATAAWCFQTQQWELAAVQDEAWCEACGESNPIEIVTLPEPA